MRVPLLSLTLLVGCAAAVDRPESRAAMTSEPPSIASAPPRPERDDRSESGIAKPDAAEKLLAPLTLDSRDTARRVLYTWTTTAQASALSRSKKLLIKGPSAASNNLFETDLKAGFNAGGAGARLSRLLTSAPLDKRRYAFSNALGWSRGPKGAPYGSVLVRMTLRKDALTLVLGGAAQPGLQPFAAIDMAGSAVDLEQLEAHPERIAVVFHAGFDGAGKPFREYVLVNEAMLESWDVGTREIVDEIAREASTIEHLAASAPEAAEKLPDELWQGAPYVHLGGCESALAWGATDGPHAAWYQTLGVGTDTYSFTQSNLDAVAKHLRAATHPEPVTVTPAPPKALRLPPPPYRPPPRLPRRGEERKRSMTIE